ncbi:XRE family transcriptional regulator [Streptomyces sp. NPDC057638]|uniref:XRE family transcriptional regulator n=1 Tax=Streptomyces sp. NPDC057638 TaxID=3346190 RepID=UPI0036760A4E
MSRHVDNDHPLVHARALFGLSQQALAERVRDAGRRARINVATTKKTVSCWEHGRTPDEATQGLIAIVFDVDERTRRAMPWPHWLPGPDLPELCQPWTAAGTVAVLDDVLRSGPMDRRKFIIVSGVTLTAMLHNWLTAHPDIAHATAQAGRRVSGLTVDRIAARITELQRDDDTYGGGDLITEAEAHLSLVHQLLAHGSYTGEQGCRLHAQAADLARMCGWMAFDAGRHATAQRYFSSAMRAARTSGDALLSANVLAFASIQHYSVGNPRDADAMIRTAQAAVRGHSTPVVDAMLSARQARALAKAGDTRACYRALNDALDHLSAGRRDNDPAWAYWVEKSEIDMLTGSCLLDLGRPAAAQTKFAEADAAYGPGYVRTHALYLSRMASSQYQQGAVDAACDTGMQALNLLETLNSGRSTDHVRDLAASMSGHLRVPAVRDFRERVAVVMAA